MKAAGANIWLEQEPTTQRSIVRRPDTPVEQAMTSRRHGRLPLSASVVATGRVLFFMALAAGMSLPARSAEVPDAGRGRLLYENHCVVCHTSKVHGRIPALVIDRGELRLIVSAWAKGQNLRWSDDDVDDVVEYLDTAYYRMPR